MRVSGPRAKGTGASGSVGNGEQDPAALLDTTSFSEFASDNLA